MTSSFFNPYIKINTSPNLSNLVGNKIIVCNFKISYINVSHKKGSLKLWINLFYIHLFLSCTVNVDCCVKYLKQVWHW